MLLGAALRFVNLGSQSYWGDEDATVRLMRDPLWFMFRHGIAGSESTPPLYYVLAAIWSRVFGIGEFGLRSFSAVVGVATIAVAYAIGVELRSRRAGLILATFVAVSPLMVWYSQDARAYSLLILLTSVALLFFVQALRTASSKSLWLWAFAATASLTAHYFAIFVILPEAFALLLIRRIRPRAIWPTALVGFTWLALLPLLVFQQRQPGHIGWIKFISLKARLEIAGRWFVSGSWDLRLLLIVGTMVLLAVVVGVGFARRGLHNREPVILAVAGAGIALPIAVAFVGLDYVYDRYLVGAWLPFAAVLAATLAGWRRAGPVLAVALCAFGLAASVKVATTSALERSDWRLAAHRVAALPSNDLLILYPGFELHSMRVYDPNIYTRTDHWYRTRKIEILAQDPWVWSTSKTLSFPVPAAFHKQSETAFSTFVLITYTANHPVRIFYKRLTLMHPNGYLTSTTPWKLRVFGYGSAATRAS